MVLLSDYLKDKYGCKVYKIALNGGFTCPNRDGTTGTGGCIFCSEGGSGEFAEDPSLSITEQIERGKKRVESKISSGKYIAYFQAYTGTYAPPDRLRTLYTEAVEHPDVVALSIATRPDCLPDEVIDLLSEINTIKPVWVELGLQTIHEATARRIRRGYKLQTFEESYRKLKEIGITVVVHVIFGLPGETPEDMLNTICYLSDISPVLDGIKIQNLQVIKGTDICRDYEERGEEAFHIMTMEEYTDLVAKAIALLPKETVVHRMTGDGPRRLLVAPLWSLDKKRVLNMLTKKTRDILE